MSAVFYWTLMSSLGLIIFVISLIINVHKINKELHEIIHLEMSCKQMQQLEEKISVFLSENSIESSSSISDIGKVLNLNIDELLDEEDYEDEQNENIIIARKCSQLISAASKDSYFSESGRTVLSDGTTYLPQAKKARKKGNNKAHNSLLLSEKATKETEYTTIALLMPLEEIFSYLSKNKFQTASVRKQNKLTQKLCDKYDVDIMTVLRRIQEVYILKESS